MATITERNGRFTARVRKHGFATITRTYTRRADALKWARATEADMEAGRYTDPAKAIPTFAAALAEYRRVAASKLKGAASYVYWFDELAAASFAELPIDTLCPADLARWRDQQAETRKPGTVARKLGLLSGFLTWAWKERGWIDKHPLRAISKPVVRDARCRTLEAEEERYLLAAADTSKAKWMGDAIRVLLHSLMRRGELYKLRREALDFPSATAHGIAHLSDCKNGEDRDVVLVGVALEAMKRLDDAAAERGDDALIPVADAHAITLAFRRTVARARQAYLQDCAAAGLTPSPSFAVNLRLHDLRHTGASLLAGELSLPELMFVGGWKTPRMVTRYTNMKAASLAAKLAKLNR